MDSKLWEFLPAQLLQFDFNSPPALVIVGVLAALGFCYTFYLLVSFGRLILSIFILPGLSVSIGIFLFIPLALIADSIWKAP